MAEAFAKPGSLPFITHYVQRRRKKRKSSLPVSVQRYFTDLTAAGGQYYSLSNAITLTGDFEIEALVYKPAGSEVRVVGNSSGFNSRVYILSDGSINFRPSNTSTDALIAPSNSVPDNQLIIVRAVRFGATGELFVGAVSVASGTVPTSDGVIDVIQRNDTSYGNGILANLKITDGSTLVGDFPLDENWTVDNIAHNRANPANNATAENITDADATERRRDNDFSPNRWVNVNDPNNYIEIAGT